MNCYSIYFNGGGDDDTAKNKNLTGSLVKRIIVMKSNWVINYNLKFEKDFLVTKGCDYFLNQFSVLLGKLKVKQNSLFLLLDVEGAP